MLIMDNKTGKVLSQISQYSLIRIYLKAATRENRIQTASNVSWRIQQPSSFKSSVRKSYQDTSPKNYLASRSYAKYS